MHARTISPGVNLTLIVFARTATSSLCANGRPAADHTQSYLEQREQRQARAHANCIKFIPGWIVRTYLRMLSARPHNFVKTANNERDYFSDWRKTHHETYLSIICDRRLAVPRARTDMAAQNARFHGYGGRRELMPDRQNLQRMSGQKTLAHTVYCRLHNYHRGRISDGPRGQHRGQKARMGLFLPAAQRDGTNLPSVFGDVVRTEYSRDVDLPALPVTKSRTVSNKLSCCPHTLGWFLR